MLIRTLYIVLLLFSISAHAQIRDGLGFPKDAAPAFNDQAILSSIQQSVEQTHTAPIQFIKLTPSAGKLNVTVRGDKGTDNFVCQISPGSNPVCAEGELRADQLTFLVEIPFGNLQPHGFQPHMHDGMSVTAWVAVAVVAVYAAKKILNRFTTGKYLADTSEHSHFILSADEMKRERARNNQALDAVLKQAEENLTGDLLTMALELSKVAGCSHDHHHHHHDGHHHEHGHSCGSPEAKKTAQTSLLMKFPRMAGNLLKDFYTEIFKPVITLAKSAKDAETRNQLTNFVDLVTRRMLKERGTAATVVTGTFVVLGQGVVEILESFVMPAGAHLFCQVGNMAILAAAASAYTAYYCARQFKQLPDMSLKERWQVIRQFSRLNSQVLRLGNSEVKDLDQKPEHEKLVLTLGYLYRLVERNLRLSRNLNDLTKPEARRLAGELGLLKRDLNGLSLRLLTKNSAEVQAWVAALAKIHSEVSGPESCHTALTAEAS